MRRIRPVSHFGSIVIYRDQYENVLRSSWILSGIFFAWFATCIFHSLLRKRRRIAFMLVRVTRTPEHVRGSIGNVRRTSKHRYIHAWTAFGIPHFFSPYMIILFFFFKAYWPVRWPYDLQHIRAHKLAACLYAKHIYSYFKSDAMDKNEIKSSRRRCGRTMRLACRPVLRRRFDIVVKSGILSTCGDKCAVLFNATRILQALSTIFLCC